MGWGIGDQETEGFKAGDRLECDLGTQLKLQ